jgi:hypothetical protein
LSNLTQFSPSCYPRSVFKICFHVWSTSNHAFANHWNWNITGTLPPAGKFKSQILFPDVWNWIFIHLNYIYNTRQFLKLTLKCVELIELWIKFYNRWPFNSYQHQKILTLAELRSAKICWPGSR